MTEIVTGTDALRQAVRAKPLNTAVFARDLGIPNQTFLAFTEGRVELKPDILKALAGHLWGGHIAYNVERDCLQSANRTEPRPMGAVPPAVRCVGCAAVCKCLSEEFLNHMNHL
jgi:hypothetical protein